MEVCLDFRDTPYIIFVIRFGNNNYLYFSGKLYAMRFMLMVFLIIKTLFATSHAGKNKDMSIFKMSIAMVVTLKTT